MFGTVVRNALQDGCRMSSVLGYTVNPKPISVLGPLRAGRSQGRLRGG